jgi:hypothetical protein
MNQIITDFGAEELPVFLASVRDRIKSLSQVLTVMPKAQSFAPTKPMQLLHRNWIRLGVGGIEPLQPLSQWLARQLQAYGPIHGGPLIPLEQGAKLWVQVDNVFKGFLVAVNLVDQTAFVAVTPDLDSDCRSILAA